MHFVSGVATFIKTVGEVRLINEFTLIYELPASHALGERGYGRWSAPRRVNNASMLRVSLFYAKAMEPTRSQSLA